MLVNPSHVFIHVWAVFRHIVAVDAPETIFPKITAGSLMSHHEVLPREDVCAKGIVEGAIIADNESTWKNCFQIRLRKTLFSSSFQCSPKTTIFHITLVCDLNCLSIWKIYTHCCKGFFKDTSNSCVILKREHKKQIYTRENHNPLVYFEQ